MSEEKAKLAVLPSREEREHQALLTVMGQMLDGLNHMEAGHACVSFDCERMPDSRVIFRVRVWDMDAKRSVMSPVMALDGPPHWCNLAHLINAAIELLRKQKTGKPTKP